MTLVHALTKTDHDIQADVLSEIERDWRFRPAEVGVEVDDGVVTLTGTVSSYVKLGDAADIAARVTGVKDVANKLTVALPGSVFADDTKIAQAVRNALLWDSVVPESRIDSIVRNGVVTLKGTVDHWFQRKSAVEAVKRLAGVVGVNDHIVIVPPARADEHVRSEMRLALDRRFPLAAVSVAVEDARVTLTGTVPSYRIRGEAEDIAWATTGVRSVVNRIRVA